MASAVVFTRQNDNRKRHVASCKSAFTQFCMHGFEQSLAGLFVLFVLKGPTKDCSKSCSYLHDCKKVEKLIFFVSWTVFSQLPLPWSDIYHLHNLLPIEK